MTVTAGVTKHTYTGNGVQTEWPVLFPFFSGEEVRAIRTSGGVDTELVYGGDYTVTRAAEGAGGTVTCALAAGETLLLYLDLALAQEIDLTNTGTLPPEVLERGLDRLTLIAQQQQEQLGRCVQIGRTSGLTPTELLTSIDDSAASCAANAQTASASAGVAAGAANAAGAARDEAAAAAASIALPVQASGDAGCGLVADGTGGWAFGGTAAGLNTGDAPEDVATNAKVGAQVAAVANSPVPAQAIIAALTGMRPDGWGPQDCDAPVCSILPDRILPHSAYWSPAGSVPAVGFRDSKPEYAPFGATPTDWEYSVAAVPPPSFGYDHHVAREMDSVTLGGAVSAANFYGLQDFAIEIDGVVVKTVTNEPVWAQNEKRTYTFPATTGKSFRINPTSVTRTAVGTYFRLGSFALGYTDVAAGSVLIPAGLQVSYADNGKVRLSEVLGAAVAVDLGSVVDGYHYLYGNQDADGVFASFGFSNIPMEVGTERKGSALMPAFTGYTLAGWGTISATSCLAGSINYAWKAFDDLNGTNDCWVADNAVGQAITLTTPTPRRITALGIRSRNDANRGDLKDFRIVADGVTVATFTNQTWIGNELKIFDVDVAFNSTLAIAVDAITKAGAASWTAPSISEIIPYFSEDHFNPVTQQTRDIADQPIRRVPFGSVVKSGGKIVAVNCYALGESTTFAANHGNLCLDDTDYPFPSPFPVASTTRGMSSVKFDDGNFHQVTGFYMSSAGVTVGSMVGFLGQQGVLKIPNILSNIRTSPTYNGAVAVDDSGYISITIDRGC